MFVNLTMNQSFATEAVVLVDNVGNVSDWRSSLPFIFKFGVFLNGEDLSTFDWDELGRRLTVYSLRRLAPTSFQEAEDAAACAVLVLCEKALAGTVKDLPPSRPVVWRWLVSVIDFQYRNRVRTKSLAMLDLTKFDAATDIWTDANSTDPEESLVLSRAAHAARERISVRLANDPLAMQVFSLALDGVETAQMQANALGKPVADIYRARRRLDGHYRHVIAEIQEDI